MAFDKTGTLKQEHRSWKNSKLRVSIFSPHELLLMASTLASRSRHPISNSIAKAWKIRMNYLSKILVNLRAKGITGVINNQQFWLGKSEWHREQTEADHGLDHIIDKMQK